MPHNNPFFHGNPVAPDQLIGRKTEVRKIVLGVYWTIHGDHWFASSETQVDELLQQGNDYFKKNGYFYFKKYDNFLKFLW